MDDTLLQVEEIDFSYSESYRALRKVSVAFAEGEMVAILGSNGAGKSTFFLCCNGVLRPQSGSLYYRGKKITDKKEDILTLRQGVGLVFQDPDSQIIAGKVESEVSFGPMNLRLSEEEVKRRVDEALKQMNITQYRDFAPQYLSGGEKKRVSIADILAMSPSMILLDEPTASLDPQNSEALEALLNELNRAGITIVISTHDVDFAYRIARRVIVFSEGCILADDTPEKVFAATEVLKQAGLKRPLLYEVYESLKQTLSKPEGHSDPDASGADARPKTIAEFKNYLDRRQCSLYRLPKDQGPGSLG
ncbi:MAG TPA: ATP-binding protein [Coriobacteriia bacterium]|nr:ATP-binding protein [Coriobacteriia bacterium]